MSYFKPLNSIENGLYFIRLSVTNNGANIYPAPDQLPNLSFYTELVGYFGIHASEVFSSDDYPSVFISSNVDANYDIYRNNGYYEWAVSFATYGLDYLPDLDIYIIGNKPSGPVYAISNKGWTYINRTKNEYDNTIYSKMLIGINNMNTTFNLSHSGNIGFIPNELNYLTFDPNILLTKNLNLINIDDNTDIFFTIPKPIRKIEIGTTDNIIGDTGQLLDICIPNKTLNGSLTLDTSNILIPGESGLTSNILMTNQSNIILKSIGDSVSLCSYKSKWIIMDKNINEIIPSYNIINTTTYDPSIYLNEFSIIFINSRNIVSFIEVPKLSLVSGKRVFLSLKGANPWHTTEFNKLCA